MKCPFCIKICRKCKERIGEARLLVAYEGNFAKDKRGKYGFLSKCKECDKKHSAEYKKTEKGKESQRKYTKKYALRKAKYDKQRYQDNREEILQNHKEYYQDHIEERLEKAKEYYQDNREEISKKQKQTYQDNREERLEKQRQYNRDNPEVVFNNQNKRRSREENQGGGITKDQWVDMMTYFEWKCAYSGEYLGGKTNNRSIDHIIPLAKGGLNEIWNCVPMMKSYNSSKHASNINEWYITQDFYSEERLNKIYEWQEYAYNKYYEEQ